jgi:hypothetical protein
MRALALHHLLGMGQQGVHFGGQGLEFVGIAADDPFTGSRADGRHLPAQGEQGR